MTIIVLRKHYWLLAVALLLLLVSVEGSGPVHAQTFLGPTPYLSFADSPFLSGTFSFFHLEDMEDHTFNTPGVSASAGAVFEPVGNTDSVDADDGSIDGSGVLGHSFFTGSAIGDITFTFDAGVLGELPTHAGIVWTDGSGTATFEAFDSIGASLGTISADLGDGNFNGGTAEDRFFGVIDTSGISAIRISGTAGGLEVDHLQYGLVTTDDPLETKELSGTRNHTVPSGTTLRGNLEADDTWTGTITVEDGADVLGNMESEGSGAIIITVGADNIYSGNIETTGDVDIEVKSDGVYSGNVEHLGDVNDCHITLTGTGVFTGNAEGCHFH